MKRKHQTTLALIFARPISANIKWHDIEALFIELGAEITEREKALVLKFSFSVRYGFFIDLTPDLTLTKVP